MAISADQFWKLAVDSGLLARERCVELNAAFAKLRGAGQQSNCLALAEWLVAQRVLTRYQASVLASGAPGPFLFGDYKLLERITRGRLTGLFRATHLPSGQAKLLMFFSGATAKDPQQWASVSRQVEQACSVRDAHVSHVTELVATKSFKFVALENLGAEAAAIATPQAPADVEAICRLGSDVARGLAGLHEQGLVHGDVRPANVWPCNDGSAKLLQYPLSRWPGPLAGLPVPSTDYRAPELNEHGREPDARSDLYGLGCTLYELIAGRVPFPGEDAAQKAQRHARETPAQLDRFTPASPELADLVAWLMHKDPAQRPPDAAQVAAALTADGAPAATPVEPQSTTSPGENAEEVVAPVATFAPSIQVVTRESKPTAAGEKVAQAGAAGRLLHTRATVAAVAAASMAIAAALVAWGLSWQSSPQPAASVATTGNPAAKAVGDAQRNAPIEPTMPAPDAMETPVTQAVAPVQATPVARPKQVIEEIEDDGQSLWTSPTAGEPLNLQYLPVGGQVFLALRPAEMLKSTEGVKAFDALGPAAVTARHEVEAALAVPLKEIEQLVVAVYPSDTDRPQLAFQVHLTTPKTEEALMVAWRRPRAAQSEDRTIYNGSTWSYYIPPEHRGRVFSIAPPGLMQEPFMVDGPPQLRKLLAASDRLRQATLLFAPSYLLTDGKAFSLGSLAQLKGPLVDFLGPHAQGAMFSAQLGDDLFLELRVQTSLDKVPQQAAREYKEKLGALPNTTEAFVLALGPHPYDQFLLSRFPRMLQLMDSYTRFGEEAGQAVLRCYLPGRAGHNLLLGAELALYEQSRAPARPATSATPAAPRAGNATAALSRKISLSFPLDTLERSLQMLSQELSVPIEIQGRDLQAEGITRNQQFSLDERDQPAGKILLRILALANPDGKLVYVIKHKPLGQGEVIWITTRAAAGRRGERIPPELEK